MVPTSSREEVRDQVIVRGHIARGRWWKWWRWTPIPKNFLPDNGTGGIMIEKENVKLSGRVVTKTSLVKNYCPAEEYHQRYLEKR